MKRNVGIAGIGYYVPERIVTNKEIEHYSGVKEDWIETKIGIKERHFASEHQALSDMAFPAALQALENSKITPSDIDLIIVCAVNHDKRVPATAVILQKMLGAKHAAAFDINVGGCPGSCYSLVIGQQFVENGTYNNVLVISGEVYSKFVNMYDDNVSFFFGDGVGATVLRPCNSKTGFLSSLLGADGEWGADQIYCEGGSAIPITAEALANKKLELFMNNKEVWKFGVKIMPQIITELTSSMNYQLSDLDWIIPHQSNLVMIKYVMSQMGFPMTKVHTNIQKYGNTGAASVPIALAEAVELKLIQPGQLVLLASFGAGFSWGGVLIRWCDVKDFDI